MQNDLPYMASEYGFIFMGLEPMTDEQLQDLIEFVGDTGVKVDPLSLPGRWDREWNAQIWLRGESTSDKPGGLGSHTYEVQKVGEGVEFRDDREAIFHVAPDGNYVYGVLDYDRTGTAFHRNEYHTTVAGPKPGSAAEELLGSGAYYWDAENDWWEIDHGL